MYYAEEITKDGKRRAFPLCAGRKDAIKEINRLWNSLPNREDFAHFYLTIDGIVVLDCATPCEK